MRLQGLFLRRQAQVAEAERAQLGPVVGMVRRVGAVVELVVVELEQEVEQWVALAAFVVLHVQSLHR